MSRNDLEVSETNYSGQQTGPEANSGAAGVDDRLLDENWEPTERVAQKGTPLFAKRVRRQPGNRPADQDGDDNRKKLILGAVALAALLLMVLAVAGVAMLFAGSQGTDQAKQEAPAEKSYQGLKVKKGFQ